MPVKTGIQIAVRIFGGLPIVERSLSQLRSLHRTFLPFVGHPLFKPVDASAYFKLLFWRALCKGSDPQGLSQGARNGAARGSVFRIYQLWTRDADKVPEGGYDD